MSERAPLSVLLVDDDLAGRMGFSALLEDAGYRVSEAGSLEEARALLGSGTVDLAILDLELRDGRGTELIPELARRHPGAAVVVMSGHDERPEVGAHSWITKGAAPAEQMAKVAAAVRRARERAP